MKIAIVENTNISILDVDNLKQAKLRYKNARIYEITQDDLQYFLEDIKSELCLVNYVQSRIENIKTIVWSVKNPAYKIDLYTPEEIEMIKQNMRDYSNDRILTYIIPNKTIDESEVKTTREVIKKLKRL